MSITVLYFAKIRAIMGVARDSFDVGPDEQPTVQQFLTETLLPARPALRPLLESCAIAVNEEYVSAEQTLKSGDRLAIIPPVSGG